MKEKDSDNSTFIIICYFFVMPWIFIGLGKVAVFVVPFFPEMIRNFYHAVWQDFALVAGFPGVIVFCIIFVALPLSLFFGAIVYGYRVLVGMMN